MLHVNTNTFEAWKHRWCYALDMAPGDRIRARREELGLSQAQLAKDIGVSQATIDKIESGETAKSKFLPTIAARLGLDLAEIDADVARHQGGGLIPGSQLIGERTFPIYASAEGGAGQIIVSTEAVDFLPRPQPVEHVREAYGLYITGDSMVPEYEPGDVALVNPRLPMIADVTAILYTEQHGEARATIKRVRRWTADAWHLRQWNPAKDFTLSRKEWTLCHRTVGKYSRR